MPSTSRHVQYKLVLGDGWYFIIASLFVAYLGVLFSVSQCTSRGNAQGRVGRDGTVKQDFILIFFHLMPSFLLCWWNICTFHTYFSIFHFWELFVLHPNRVEKEWARFLHPVRHSLCVAYILCEFVIACVSSFNTVFNFKATPMLLA